jgi:riboflavin transporter FmnP
MHFVATGIVAVAVGVLYSRKKTKKTAIIALAAGTIIAVIVMCIMNLIVTPVYMGAPRSAVVAMIPTVIIPFNLLKAGLNSVFTFILYKRVSGFLHGEGKTVTAQNKTE